MKTLYLVRHAKSSWDNLDIPDFDRPLNERGRHDSPHMGKLLHQRNVAPGRMISSPAQRALETCKAFADALHFDPHSIVKLEKLYHASLETWFEVLRSLPEHTGGGDDVVMIFGHNPGITDFTNSLLNVSIDNIPTCGIVYATLKIETWKAVAPGSGHMNSFDYPKKA
jgi:phosphohistidine phosphatase